MAIVELKCALCADAQGNYQVLHSHLLQAHADQVVIEEEGTRRYYRVVCPLCEESYRQAIKSGHAGQPFVEEFEKDIRLVGSDILLQHLIGEHPEGMGLKGQEDGSEGQTQ